MPSGYGISGFEEPKPSYLLILLLVQECLSPSVKFDSTVKLQLNVESL